jgi:hypothetical protein
MSKVQHIARLQLFHINLHKILGLKLMVTGMSQCDWKKGKGKKEIKLHGSQKFLDFVTYFFGKESKKNCRFRQQSII